ncbi:MAG: KamA family radical SAM protein, partial [Myxococcales bacterium]|nr:KamA family radical SAM protein [Myxococcales bacterium]
YYDQLTGISVYTAPSVKPGQVFLYFDPIDLLPEEGQARWADESEQAKMVDEAIEIAREAMHAG